MKKLITFCMLGLCLMGFGILGVSRFVMLKGDLHQQIVTKPPFMSKPIKLTDLGVIKPGDGIIDQTKIKEPSFGLVFNPKLYFLPVDLGYGFSFLYYRRLELNAFYSPRYRRMGVGITYPVELRYKLLRLKNLEVGVAYYLSVEGNSFGAFLALPF